MATKVNTSGMKRKLGQVSKLVNTDDLSKELGETVIRGIKGKTRKGLDLVNGGKQGALASSTIAQRRYLDDHNSTASTYSPARSNLTFTGQLLDSLKWFRIGNIIRIMPTGQRRPYKRGSKKSIANQDVANFLKEQGREFLGVDNPIKKQLKSIIRNFIRRNIRRK